MIRAEFKRLIFNIGVIWFSDSLFDDNNYSSLRFRRCRFQKNNLGFDCSKEVTSLVDLTPDFDQIWKNIKKASRNSITRAERDGVIIKYNQNFDEFYNIYKAHARKKGYMILTPQKKSDLKKYCTLFTAEYNGEILGGHLFIEDWEHIVYFIGATKTFENDKVKRTLKGNASHLIQWEAMKYAKQKGLREFDMGGLATNTINDFKESFGGKRVTYFSYIKHYDPIYRLALSYLKFSDGLRLRMRKIGA